MAAAALSYPQPIVSRCKDAHTATVIMLHGLGDTGRGWRSIADQFGPELGHVKFVFPTAPMRPIVRNGGMVMTGWYPEREDAAALMESQRYIEELIQAELASGIPSQRVAVAGFSQGGSLALMMLRSDIKLAAVVCMSGYAQLQAQPPMFSEANKATPILMCHGDEDTMVAYQLGKGSYEHLHQLGAKVEFLTYEGMAHSACAEELQTVLAFLKTHLA